MGKRDNRGWSYGRSTISPAPRRAVHPRQLAHSRGWRASCSATSAGLHRRRPATRPLRAADRTLFLDEIREIALDAGQLLRVLQERSFRQVGGRRQVDVRMVAATNRDEAFVQQGGSGRTCSASMQSRSSCPVARPPGTHRALRPLADRLARRFPVRRSAEGRSYFREYDWPETSASSNVLERAFVLCEAGRSVGRAPVRPRRAATRWFRRCGPLARSCGTAGARTDSTLEEAGGVKQEAASWIRPSVCITTRECGFSLSAGGRGDRCAGCVDGGSPPVSWRSPSDSTAAGAGPLEDSVARLDRLERARSDLRKPFSRLDPQTPFRGDRPRALRSAERLAGQVRGRTSRSCSSSSAAATSRLRS
jgi:hypothetical protein